MPFTSKAGIILRNPVISVIVLVEIFCEVLGKTVVLVYIVVKEESISCKDSKVSVNVIEDSIH